MKHRNLIAMGIAVGLAGLARAGNTCTYSNGWDTTPSGSSDAIIVAASNLTWNASMPSNVASWTQQAGYTGTVTFATVYGTNGFTNFTVSGDVTLNGGAWTHTTNTTTEAYRLRVAVGGNLLITNATITADLCGYYATGPGCVWDQSGVYGGTARGSGNGFVNAQVYGSVTAPTNLGSGGGYGGGAILLTVARTTTVASAGTISANGGTGINGGPSGGSIYLTTGWLNGNGTIRANGGTGNNRASGSGGRIAVILTGSGADFTSWTGTNTAYGATVSFVAAAGTVYLRTTAGFDTLIIDNNNNNPQFSQIATVIPSGTPSLNSFSNVVIRNKGILGVKSDTTLDFSTFQPTTYGSANSYLAIIDDTSVTYPANWTFTNYTVFLPMVTKTLTNVTIGANGALAHYQNFTVEAYKLNLTIPGNLWVQSNGMISAEGVGYSGSGSGPGGQSDSSAAYGGTATGTGLKSSNTYGSVIAPTNLGSTGSAGAGGAILLTVAGTTRVDSAGIISANGAPSGGYGGAGGSVYLTTGWLMGSGTIRANGGTGNNRPGCSGGRVAIVLTGSGADFTTNYWTGTSTAYGYSTAAAGTVYRQAAGVRPRAGTVFVDNNNIATNNNYTALPAFSTSTENISQTVWVTTNKGKIGMVTNAVIAGLTVNTSSYLELAGYTLSVKALTVTNKVYKSGIYGPHDTPVSLFSDFGSSGKVIVNTGVSGTTILFK